ncbi:MAG: M1 family metallopeptidase [Bacteroidales bacterium]
MQKNTLLFLFLITSIAVMAQEPTPYWQQKTDYTIDATLDINTDIISGKQKLIYYNQSPHTLDKLYFHLYQNAFQPGSYMDNRQKNYKNAIHFGEYENQKKGMTVSNVQVNGQAVAIESDNTILKIELDKPLLPGQHLTISMDFKTYFDITAGWRRMRVFKAYGFKHYNGGHWYPRIAVFDRKFGWTADQHMVHEFYGDFGSYDVTLNFPEHYIVDATGILQNKKEAMPKALREKLDLSNFKDKPLYSKPSEVIPPGKEQKTWHFKANNVHDFAFVASPLFRIGEVSWQGVTCRALAMEPHAAKWQDAAQLTADIIEIFSTDFGMYAYPKMIVADVRSGMEYPMLTMNNGLSPDYAYIFSHEIGHNWFFGAVGSNETYRAVLDEGFTQFLTAHALQKLQEFRPITSNPKRKFPQNKINQHDLLYKTVFRSYYQDAFYHKGTRLNQHSDKFNSSEPYGRIYRQTYYKGASMLYNLKYVLGDSLFEAAVAHYYKTWQFRHPYLEDMRNTIINFTKVDLNWFFDQWLNSTKTIDYAVKKVRQSKDGHAQITLERKGRMEMPLDVLVVFTNGDSSYFHIPNRNYVKSTNARVLEKWFGWDQIHPTYTFDIPAKTRIKNIEIDPHHQISDMNRANNSWKTHIDTHFDYLVKQPENPYRYETFIRPDFWWNNIDGLKYGFHIDGSYMKELHQFDLSFFHNTLMGSKSSPVLPVSWDFSYNNRIGKPAGKTFIGFNSIFDADWNANRLSLTKTSENNKNIFSVSINSYRMYGRQTLEYYPSEVFWSTKATDQHHFFLETEYTHQIHQGEIRALLTTSLDNFNQSRLELQLKRSFAIGPLTLRNRGYLQYNLSDYTMAEEQLLLSGANGLQMMQNRISRSTGIIPKNWLTFGSQPNHFHLPGGLNLRGYTNAILSLDRQDGAPEYFHYGNTGIAWNSEISTIKWFQPVPARLQNYFLLDFYSFFDAALLDNASLYHLPGFENVFIDAGLGISLNILQWYTFDKIDPLTLRFDMPLFLNIKPYGDSQHFMFRWLVGLEKTI